MNSLLRVLMFACLTTQLCAQDLSIIKTGDNFKVSIKNGDKTLLSSPDEGLWSIATGWENGWPAEWRHVQIAEIHETGEWKEVTGKFFKCGCPA